MSEANTWCDHNYTVSCSLPAGHEGPHDGRMPRPATLSMSAAAYAREVTAAEEHGYQRGLAEAATAQRALSRIGDRLQYHGEVCPPGRLRQLLLAAAKDARSAAAPRGNPQVDDAVVEYGHGYVQGRADALEVEEEKAEERGYHRGYLGGGADAGSCQARRCVLNPGHEGDHFYIVVDAHGMPVEEQQT